MSLAQPKAHQLKAGALIEDNIKHDGDKLPTKRQLIRLEQKFDNLPTYEVLIRLYKRHALGIWQIVATTAVVLLVWQQVR